LGAKEQQNIVSWY